MYFQLSICFRCAVHVDKSCSPSCARLKVAADMSTVTSSSCLRKGYLRCRLTAAENRVAKWL